MKCGQGRLVCVTGEAYEGEFRDDCYCGKGVLKLIGEASSAVEARVP